MIKETNNKKMKCYYCEECEMVYINKKKACECEDWCRKHKSCNMEIIKNAIEMKGGKNIHGG